MGKLKLEAQRRVEQDRIRIRGQEIVECGEEKLKEAESYAHIPIVHPLETIEAIDIDDIAALMECGKEYTLKDIIEQFGLSPDIAKSLLAPCECTDIAKAIAEAESTESIVSIFDNENEYEVAESSDSDLPIDELREYRDEELRQMVYELEHAFD